MLPFAVLVPDELPLVALRIELVSASATSSEPWPVGGRCRGSCRCDCDWDCCLLRSNTTFGCGFILKSLKYVYSCICNSDYRSLEWIVVASVWGFDRTCINDERRQQPTKHASTTTLVLLEYEFLILVMERTRRFRCLDEFVFRLTL